MADPEPTMGELLAELQLLKVQLKVQNNHIRSLDTRSKAVDEYQKLDVDIQICLAAAEILKWVDGGARVGLYEPSNTFGYGRWPTSGAFEKFWRRLRFCDFPTFYTFATGIVNKRNQDVHVSRLEDLDTMVAQSLRGFALYIELKTERPDQWKLIKNYDDLKGLCPLYFPLR